MDENSSFENYSAPPPPARPVIQENIVTPFVTYVILVVTIVIYVLQLITETFLSIDLPAALGMKINQFILAGELWRLITPMFLHGSILHIGFNMYALNVIGAPLERRFGHWRFLALYLSGAFAGNVFSFLLSPNPSLGASTAIFGLFGAEMIFLYQHRELFGSQARAALQNVITIAIVNFLLGLSPGIDNWGHLGGLVGGLMFTWFGGPQLKLGGAYPVFQIQDDRGPGSTILATVLVFVAFAALAATKFLGLWPL